MIWKLIKLLLFVVFGAFVLMAQDKKADAPKPDPVLSAEDKAAILEVQVRLLQEQNEYAQLQARIKELNDKFIQDQAALLKAQKDAVEHAHADDYTLNLQTLKFEKKPAPPPAPPK